MDICDFGDALIRTEDLDPVYSAIYRAKLPEDQLCRLLFAYWSFYHLGFSAYVSERQGEDYWTVMKEAARNETSPPLGNGTSRWPRGTERRHFRGSAAIQAVDWFSSSIPEHWVRYVAARATEKEVIAEVVKWPQFGPWIAFKVADMIERVYGSKVLFDPNIGLMYDSPRVGLEMLAADKTFIAVDRSLEGLYHNLLTYFRARKAPPSFDRQCGPQEVETILCKWGSMKGGHYHVGKDIKEVRHALKGWGKTADRMFVQMPEEVQNGK